MQTAYRRLRQSDRATIHRLLKQGKSQKEMAAAIGFSESAVSREIKRNSGQRGYRALQAGRLAAQRRVTQRRRRRMTGETAELVEQCLRRRHSPVQITGSLRELGRYAPSHETIYRYIARDRKAGGDLHSFLRINNGRRRRRRVKARRGSERIPGRVGLEKRPASVETRRYYGDWEGDLVEGAGGSGFILTIAERKSRFTLFERLTDKSSAAVTEAMVRLLRWLKVRTLTFDNGLEFAGHLEVARELGAKSYFCAPYHSWEKGLVENHNGLLRQYYPKGSSFADIDAAGLRAVEDEINERPREVLGFRTPFDHLPLLVR